LKGGRLFEGWALLLVICDM